MCNVIFNSSGYSSSFIDIFNIRKMESSCLITCNRDDSYFAIIYNIHPAETSINFAFCKEIRNSVWLLQWWSMRKYLEA